MSDFSFISMTNPRSDAETKQLCVQTFNAKGERNGKALAAAAIALFLIGGGVMSDTPVGRAALDHIGALKR